MKKSTRYPSEVREWAVRLVRKGIGEHGSEWLVIVSIAEKVGCSLETLHKWLRSRSAGVSGPG